MRWRWQALAVASVGIMLVAAEPARDDAKALQGAWVVTESKYNGEAQEVDGMSRLVIKGDRYEFEQPGKETVSGTFKLDPSKGPKTIDVEVSEGPDQVKGKKGRGIYALEGDTLKWAFGELGDGERPSGFTTTDGSNLFVLQAFKREKL